MSNDIIRSLESDDFDLLQEYEKLVVLKETLENQRANKFQQLQSEKQVIIEGQVNKENLSDRNEEVRRKFSVLDVLVKNDSDKISEEMRNYLKVLNVKTSIEQYDSGDVTKNFLVIKLEFPEINNVHVKILYDPVTEDFECKD